jgi:8-oxo-dGTP pyrophosphatase MutT (NUDIX family)
MWRENAVHHGVDLSLKGFESRLAGRKPAKPVLDLGPKRAAVAALIRFDRGPGEVLLMKRAAREGDRWSGHISFPGGREEPADTTLLATAVRETKEEVGIDLSENARLLGGLDPVRAKARGRVLPMTITPYVFVQEREVAVDLGEEATDVFWLPLADVASGRLDDVYRYKMGPLSLKLPCWRYEDFVVWGLTHEMIKGLLRVIRVGG